MVRKIFFYALIVSFSSLNLKIAAADPLANDGVIWSQEDEELSATQDLAADTSEQEEPPEDAQSPAEEEIAPNPLTETSGEEEPSANQESSVEAGESEPAPLPEQPPEKAQSSLEEELAPNPNPLELPDRVEQVEITKTIPLTLDQALLLAKNNNRQLKIARLQLERSQATLDQARAEWFPTFSLGGNATRSADASSDISVDIFRSSTEKNIAAAESSIPGLEQQLALVEEQLAQIDTNDPEQILPGVQLLMQQRELQTALQSQQASLVSARRDLARTKPFDSTVLDGNINLNYAVYSPQRRPRISLAEEQLRISELEATRIEQDLTLEVFLSYYNLQQADTLVLINQADVEARSQRLEGIQLMLEATLATSLDLLNAQVELGNSIQTLRNSQAQQETARRELARVLNLPPSVTPVTADPVEVKSQWDLSLPESIILAFDKRVELEQELARKRQAEADRSLELAAVLPQLNLFANYNVLRAYTDDPDEFASQGFGDGYAFGLSFNWTFFDSGRAGAGARRAEADIAIAEQQYGLTAQNIRFEVERAYLQLPTQLENVETAKAAVKLAEEAVKGAQIRFQASVTDQTEVLDAQTRLVVAQNNLVDAVITYNRSLAQLQRALGLDYQEMEAPPAREGE